MAWAQAARAAGRCSWDMLGVFAEFETNLRRERQLVDGVMGGLGDKAVDSGLEIDHATEDTSL